MIPSNEDPVPAATGHGAKSEAHAKGAAVPEGVKNAFANPADFQVLARIFAEALVAEWFRMIDARRRHVEELRAKGCDVEGMLP